MTQNIKSIKPYYGITKQVISFDKKGKRIVTEVKQEDMYLVTTLNNNSFVVNRKDFSKYNIIGDVPEYVKEKKNVENNSEQVNNNTENNLDSPKITQTQVIIS